MVKGLRRTMHAALAEVEHPLAVISLFRSGWPRVSARGVAPCRPSLQMRGMYPHARKQNAVRDTGGCYTRGTTPKPPQPSETNM